MYGSFEDHSRGNDFLWGLLSFFIPIVGLVLCIVWREDRPSNAKACLIGMAIPLGLMALAMVSSLIFGLIASFGFF